MLSDLRCIAEAVVKDVTVAVVNVVVTWLGEDVTVWVPSVIVCTAVEVEGVIVLTVKTVDVIVACVSALLLVTDTVSVGSVSMKMM